MVSGYLKKNRKKTNINIFVHWFANLEPPIWKCSSRRKRPIIQSLVPGCPNVTDMDRYSPRI